MLKKSKTASPPIARTSGGLRDAIFDEIDAMRAGESNPTRANAVAKLATSIVETVRMEIEVHRHMRKGSALPATTKGGKTSPLLGSSLPLGE